jgi:hypothetical protein
VSWLRVDDSFAEHPKILKLARTDRWTWVEILCYCARQNTKGYVPPNIGELLRYATPAFIRKALAAGLLEEDQQGPKVHDWGDYNGRDPKIMQADRKRKQRENAVTSAVTSPGQERDQSRDENVTRAQARASDPSPSPTPSTKTAPPTPPHVRYTDDGDVIVTVFDEPEQPAGGQSTNGRTAEEQARIDEVDSWWQNPLPSDHERDPYVEPFNDLSPLGEQLAAAKAQEEQSDG